MFLLGIYHVLVIKCINCFYNSPSHCRRFLYSYRAPMVTLKLPCRVISWLMSWLNYSLTRLILLLLPNTSLQYLSSTFHGRESNLLGVVNELDIAIFNQNTGQSGSQLFSLFRYVGCVQDTPPDFPESLQPSWTEFTKNWNTILILHRIEQDHL